MTGSRATSTNYNAEVLDQKIWTNSYYGLLGLHPSASSLEIRRSYRELSKLYHPDTTDLPTAIACAKFQQLNEAYSTLSSPEKRLLYDQKIRYSRMAVIQPLNQVRNSPNVPQSSSSAYLDPTDRPLSPGEIFVLLILGLTLIGCLVLAIAIAIIRGNNSFPTPELTHQIILNQLHHFHF